MFFCICPCISYFSGYYRQILDHITAYLFIMVHRAEGCSSHGGECMAVKACSWFIVLIKSGERGTSSFLLLDPRP